MNNKKRSAIKTDAFVLSNIAPYVVNAAIHALSPLISMHYLLNNK